MAQEMKAILALLLMALSLSAQDFDFAQLASAPVTSTPEFDPSTVSGLVGWWRADSGVYTDAGTTPATDGQAVYQWNNKVVGGSNLVSEVSGSRPAYRTGQINGKAAIHFDGGSDWMTNQWSQTITNTVFFVYFITNTAAVRVIFDGYSTSGREALFYGSTDTVTLRCGATGVTTPGTGPQGVWTYMTVKIARESSFVRTNGVSMDLPSLAAATTSDGLTLGSIYSRDSSWFPGMIAEFLWYHATLSESDISAIQNYLKSRYGL